MTAKIKAPEQITGRNAVDEAEEVGVQTFDKTVANLKDGMSTATHQFEQVQARMKENMNRALRTTEEMISFGQGNVEALVKSGQIWAAGMQDLSKHMTSTAQTQLSETLSTFKALGGAKSLKEAIDLQTGLVRSAIEKTMSETGHLTDASFKLAEQALAPLSHRVSLAAERFGKPV